MPNVTTLWSITAMLTHFAHSLARGTVNDWMAILSVFFSIFDHSAIVKSGYHGKGTGGLNSGRGIKGDCGGVGVEKGGRHSGSG